MRVNAITRLRAHVVIVMMALGTLVLPAPARAQSSTTGAIAGVAKDQSGGVLPGVTVEAASPSLIEKVRTAVTDEHGEYKIVDLRPGTYSVTFSLNGFSSVKRDGLELNTGVNLPVNADLKVGSVAETITVTGASPVVDVQNVRTQNVMTREVLDTLPQAGTIQGFAALTLGAVARNGTQDVGGNKGETTSDLSIHNSRAADGRLQMDGMSFASGLTAGGQGQRSFVVNKISTQEVTLQTGSGGADGETSGANLNIVPKEGGNQFKGAFQGTGAGPSFQATNLTDALRARGLSSGQGIKKVYDVGVGLGGPLVRNRLWFYTGQGYWGNQEYAPGNYFNKTQGTLFYTPDLSRPAYTDTWNMAWDVRLTWQASAKNKFTLGETFEDFCLCFARVDLNNQAPEAANNNHNAAVHLFQATWNNTATNKLLFQAGYTAALAPGRVNELSPGEKNTDVPITEQSTAYQYNAFLGLGQTSYGHPLYNEVNGRGSVSYITGSHALKGGITWQWNNENYDNELNSLPGVGPVSYVFRKPTPDALPLPVSLTEYASPHHSISRSWVYAFYAQDQWTLKKLTLNLGVRYDTTRGYVPAQTRPGGVFTPPVQIEAVNGVPSFNDISPRVGGAYDLFGNGKSALKFSLGRYVLGDHTTTTVANNPAESVVTSATRNWNDFTFPAGDPRNGNYLPDCVLTDVNANGECGALSRNGFGTTRITTMYADDVLSGWQVRPMNWQTAASFQQELRPGMAVMIGYYRTSYGNFRATQNQAVTPADFGSYCITTPIDPRVSGLNGSQVCGFHDISPAKFGLSQAVVTRADYFGGQSEAFNGVDIALSARYGHGGLLNGGVSTGKTVTDTCAIETNYPNVNASNSPSQFCHRENPWPAGTQVKFGLAYPLPWWGLQTSATYQNLPGLVFNSSYVATNAEIAQSLGRNVGSCGTAAVCAATVTLTNALYPPSSQSEGRLNQLDLRLTKIVALGRYRVKGNFDVYNVFNTATILSQNTTYSTTNTYLRPTSILGPRMFKFGVNLDF